MDERIDSVEVAQALLQTITHLFQHEERVFSLCGLAVCIGHTGFERHIEPGDLSPSASGPRDPTQVVDRCAATLNELKKSSQPITFGNLGDAMRLTAYRNDLRDEREEELLVLAIEGTVDEDTPSFEPRRPGAFFWAHLDFRGTLGEERLTVADARRPPPRLGRLGSKSPSSFRVFSTRATCSFVTFTPFRISAAVSGPG